MPRRSRPNIGRRTRLATAQRRRRSKRTAQEHIDYNENAKIKAAQKRAEKLMQPQVELLRVLELEATHSSQQIKEEVQPIKEDESKVQIDTNSKASQ